MKTAAFTTLLIAFSLSLAAQGPYTAEPSSLTERCRQFNQRVSSTTAKNHAIPPELCSEMDWNPNTSTWDSLYLYEFTHVLVGTEYKVATEKRSFRMNIVNWEYEYRDSMGYDAWGNRDYLLQQTYVTNAFQDYSRTTHVYDVWGTELEFVFALRGLPGWDTVDYFRSAVTYNAGNEPLEIVKERKNVIAQSWSPWQRTLRTYYGNGEQESESAFDWQGGMWFANLRTRDYLWQDYEKRYYTQVYEDYWVNGSYQPLSLNQRTYSDTLGSHTGYFSTYNVSTQAYDTVTKYVNVYDAKGNRTLYEDYNYDFAADTFYLSTGYRTAYTYNADGYIVDALEEYKGGPSVPWINFKRYSCDGFVVGQAPAVTETAFAGWAPHPVGRSAALLVEGRPGKVVVEVSSLEGKLLRRIERAHVGGAQRHAVELGLPVGMYLYRVELGGESVVGKMLVRD